MPVGKGDSFGVEQVPHLYFYFPPGKGILSPQLGFFLIIILAFGGNNGNPGFTVCLLLIHTNWFYIYIFLYVCSLPSLVQISQL